MKLDILEGFYTSSYIRSCFMQSILKKMGDSLLSRRFLEGVSGFKIHPHWRFEWKELIYARLYGTGEKTQAAVYARDEKFDQYMAIKLPNLVGNVFWGFQGSAFHSLASAQKAGKRTIVELATAHVTAAKTILGEEQRLHPEWADSFDNLEFPTHYEYRLEQEPHLADYVVAASTFTKSTLLEEGIEERKIKLLPLGTELNHIPFGLPQEKVYNRPLKLLFVGRITQRKGIVYLLEAMKQFHPKEVELHIIGYVHGSGEGLKPYAGLYTLHPPMSQQQLYNEYQNYDALVLPSVFEGFGLVIVEAMAASLPVIATEHTIAPDIIEQEKDGFVIPIRDVQAIVEAIKTLLDYDKEQFMQIRKNARAKAMEYTWEVYEKRLKKLLSSID